MASAAFKSNSRRGYAASTSDNSRSQNKVPPKRRTQRSLSVSAVSRKQVDVDSDFLNKRDNPLFWSTTSPPDKETQPPENDATLSQINGATTSISADTARQRGRSVTRNVDLRSKKTIGRSLSRGPYFYGASESEVEQESSASTNYRSISNSKSASNNMKRTNLVTSGASETEVEQESVRSSNYGNTRKSNIASSNVQRSNSVRNPASTLERTRSLDSVSNRRSVLAASDDSTASLQIPTWEDEISTASLSETEEKTIRAVCEQMKSIQGNHFGGDTSTSGIYETVRSEVRRAISDIQSDLESAIRRNNATGNTGPDATNIPPDLVNPGAVELVLDIRREYATKLEESQERARKLRSDLAVEERRGQELSRILKETLPDPKVSTIQKPRLARRTSNERKKMSKRLTEEAMSYFDECVSISTFDSSDFSAPEDPPLNSVGPPVTMGCTASLPHENPCVSTSNGPSNYLNNKKEAIGDGQTHRCGDFGLTADSRRLGHTIDSNIEETVDSGRKSRFSFAREPTGTPGLQHEISSYIKHFKKDMDKDDEITSQIMRSSNSFNVEDYDLQGHKETLLFDRVLFKNRIESGGLHLCAGGIAISFSPFASVV